MQNITGINIQEHDQSKRIVKISLENEIIDKLIFPFNKFDLTALELKPFTSSWFAISRASVLLGKYFSFMSKFRVKSLRRSNL